MEKNQIVAKIVHPGYAEIKGKSDVVDQLDLFFS